MIEWVKSFLSSKFVMVSGGGDNHQPTTTANDENEQQQPQKKTEKVAKRADYTTDFKINDRLAKYLQEIVFKGDVEEYKKFTEIIYTQLPMNYRIVASSPYGGSILRYIEEEIFPGLRTLTDDNQNPIPLPYALPWYPSGLAFQYDTEIRALSKLPEFQKLKEFLFHCSETGNVIRQEAVSLLPVLFLDIQHDSKILEMCAAPGSKTTQIIELLDQAIKDKF